MLINNNHNSKSIFWIVW